MSLPSLTTFLCRTFSTYAQGSNDLKVQANGDGGLEEVADEFRDGRSVVSHLEVPAELPPRAVTTHAEADVAHLARPGPTCFLRPAACSTRLCA